MHQELFRLPVLGISVKTYGFFLMVGFLSAVWLAMRRAQRVKADPDRVLDIAFLALVFGVGGARLFYVIHYWKTQFADAPNKLFAMIDIRQGGLEFLGGLLGAIAATAIYLAIKRQSFRLYLDIMAPGAMWGLAFGRLGCFFNGCCFGGLCVVGATAEPQYPWAVQFPYGSPPHEQAWRDRQVSVPAELIYQSSLVPPTALALPVELRERPQRQVEELEKALADAKSGEEGDDAIRKLTGALEAAKRRRDALRRDQHLDIVEWAQKFPSRNNPKRKTSVSELQQLASQCVSPPVHPAQLYAAANALLLSGILSAVFYQRKRHGVVLGLMFVLYPIGRVLLELIRADNPHDTLGLTVSQFISLGVFITGLVYLYVLYKFLPQRSPLAD